MKKVFLSNFLFIAGWVFFATDRVFAGAYLPPPPPAPPPPAPSPPYVSGVTPPVGFLSTRNNATPAPADYHGETAQSRLLVMQKGIQAALDYLHQAPVDPQGGFVEQAMAEVAQAQVDTASALNFVKAHPEMDSLPAVPTRVGMPNLRSTNAFPGSSRSVFQNTYPTLAPAKNALDAGLSTLINGPYPGTSFVIGDLGGYRDKILRNVGQAIADLNAGATAFNRATNPPRGTARGTVTNPATGEPVPPPPASTVIPTHIVVPGSGGSTAEPGTVSGIVVDEDGKAVNVLVAFLAVNGNGRSPGMNSTAVIRPGGTPASITDDNGAFTLKDIPPGRYFITFSRAFDGGFTQGASSLAIEVKAGAATTLPNPISLIQSPL